MAEVTFAAEETDEAKPTMIHQSTMMTVKELCLELEFGTEQSQEDAAAIAMDMAMDGEWSKELGDHHAVMFLVQILKLPRGDDCKQWAAGALSTLSYRAENAAELIKRGGVDLLVDLLRNKGSDGRKGYGAWALATLASVDDDHRKAVAAAGTIGAVVQLLQAADVGESAKRYACSTVWNLCPDADLRKKVVEAGAVEALAPLAASAADEGCREWAKIALDAVGWKSKEVQERCAAARRGLVGEEPDNKREVDADGAPAPIMGAFGEVW